MDDYCKNHTALSYCERVNMKVPPTFCLLCRGNWERYYKENPEKLRPLLRKPVEDDGETTSVLISIIEQDLQYIEKTIEDIKKNALGKLEIIVFCDGFLHKEKCRNKIYSLVNETNVILGGNYIGGQRYAMNEMAKIAKGKFLFKIDGHCRMSPDWDARMKASCKNETIVTAVFDHLDENFEPEGRDSAFVRLDKHAQTHFLRPWKPLRKREIEEETMAFTGCAWMIRKDYYNKLGGCHEPYGKHGALGSEWSLKTWLTGGKILIRTDVVCYHLFRAKAPFRIDWPKRFAALKDLRRRWYDAEDKRIKKPIQWLFYKFKEQANYQPLFRRRVNAAV